MGLAESLECPPCFMYAFVYMQVTFTHHALYVTGIRSAVWALHAYRYLIIISKAHVPVAPYTYIHIYTGMYSTKIVLIITQ